MSFSLIHFFLVVIVLGSSIQKQQNPSPWRNGGSIKSKLSKTVYILGTGKKVPSPYTFKNQEKSYQELAKRAFNGGQGAENNARKVVAAAGSMEMGVAPLGDRGFLSAVVHSYNNHYILQTTPEDWWYTVIWKIATAVEQAREEAESRSGPDVSQKFREFFVAHDGKKMLTVLVPPGPLNELNYSSIFDNLTEQIRSNIKVPEFVETIRADFSTSSSTHVIESEITLMSSMQNYFEYKMYFLCGIPQIEMIGTEEDWRKLKDKFIKLRKVLAPVETYFVGFDGWWDKIEVIFQRLIDTYTGYPDLEWWSRIFNREEPWGSGPQFPVLTGWFIRDFLNGVDVETFAELPSGLTTVPLILAGAGYPTPVNTTLVAGIAGIQVDGAHQVPKVRALHGWALYLDEADVPEKGEMKEDERMKAKEGRLESDYTIQWGTCDWRDVTVWSNVTVGSPPELPSGTPSFKNPNGALLLIICFILFIFIQE